MTRPTEIHPTAVIDPGAELGAGVQVGPYSIVGKQVRLGDDCVVGPHSVLDGDTTFGPENRIFQFASIGAPPQDLKYHGEHTRVEIGARNTFRECVTVHSGTDEGGGLTRIGDDNLLMAYSHVAHDCTVMDHVVMANAATLAGHVVVEAFAIVGGLAAVHQFCRVGESAILGGGAMVTLDVPPYCLASGDRAKLHGLNLIGLRRRGMDEATVRSLRSAYRTLFQSGAKLRDALASLKDEFPDCPEVHRLGGFIENSQRGICR